MEQAIKKAIEGGYPAPRGNYYNTDGTLGGWWYKWKTEGEYGEEIECENPCCFDHPHYFLPVLMNPLFWQALGKQQGWKPITMVRFDRGHEKSQETWLYYWHTFIDHIADGKSINDFFNNLLK